MATPQTVLHFLRQAHARGEASALIVLTAVEGGAARGVGSLMGVSEAGPWAGSLSGGCTEAALAGEARRVIAAGKAETLRIGAGSPLIDIRLPCGSAIDLLIIPAPDMAVVEAALAQLAARNPVTLELATDGSLQLAAAPSPARGGWAGETFRLTIVPQLRLVIAGHGEEVEALARLAKAWGADTAILTPDEHLAADPAVFHLKTPGSPVPLELDRWSALVMLFHDHDWEVPLLARALDQPALWIGAMGSRATHVRRLAALAGAGVPESRSAAIHGPIGLIPSARDPETLALSVLAEVVAAYKAKGFP
ncbi:XdhC family protein [Novosphingobium sp. TH158]|uniref:XdhC family protein n=1 Tax=Novosphingobium sp. TH158 TaxID=2067455 RepID=UPI000C79E8B0|nr:XdhC family protein [Novosphingobium sp. TH158]PLK27599.1 xanthine dehydrogenase [Novosphingobium sp. TH158]